MKTQLLFGLVIAALLLMSGCETRKLAPAAEYDQHRVEQIRETLDQTLQE